MSEFKIYINKLLRKTKLDKAEKEDLENELLDHLNNIKEDYLKQGLAEDISIDRAIADFKKSDFLKEINNFSSDKKLSGLNLGYLFKVSSILLKLYLILILITVTMGGDTETRTYTIYALVMVIISFVNYSYACKNFESRKDIVLNVSVTAITFFVLEEFVLLALTTLNSMFNHGRVLIVGIGYLDMIIIHVICVFGIILFAFITANNINRDKIKFEMQYKEVMLMLSAILLNLIYFVFPNGFYLSNKIVTRIFNTNVEVYGKRILYMEVNGIIVINIGLLILISFFIYKIYKVLFRIKKEWI